MKPAMTPQQAKLSDTQQSALMIYRELVSAGTSLPAWLWYEFLLTLIGPLPGVAGLGLRSMLYPSLFKRCGRRPAIGRGVAIRNPQWIELGSGFMADDFSVLDAHGKGAGIEIGDYVSIGRFSTLAAKEGRIKLGPGVNIGSYCRIATQSLVELGESVLVAAYVYIGPGNHQQGDESVPLISREMDIKGGVRIGAHSWIGTRATILDGVTIGERAVIGAHSLVRDDVPSGAVVAGTPAKIIT